MGHKLRNAQSETGQLTEFIGRKFRNHTPMNAIAPKAGPSGSQEEEIKRHGEDTLFYTKNGRTFKVTVMETDEDIPMEAKTVGH
jgi:hypothetical protein